MQRTPGKHGIADMWYRPEGTLTKLAKPGTTPKRPDGEGSRWRAWYVDTEGTERTKRFASKAPAEAWLSTQTAALTNGTHVDPQARQGHPAQLLPGMVNTSAVGPQHAARDGPRR